MTKKQLIPKSKRHEAERACEWALMEYFDCSHTRRALRTKYTKVDFFGADVIGLSPLYKYWVQVTAGQASAVSTRKSKMSQYPWHNNDIIMVWQLTYEQNPRDKRKKQYMFNVWLLKNGQWEKQDQLIVKNEWFTAYDSKPTE